ncbi:hypothetical protein C8F04DRAFT_1122183 [Mycena alexandri]|uniref:DUF6534 domain-containing protein n=1 Tax=Mycena alexandri TaxID=1745969 RepID=A0AAD6X074_9AGAR|nr:hypothetical protein C8F04DRAFT_1122183 [Mycena alexandri]
MSGPAANPGAAFVFNPDNTLGAFQIGVLISYVLFGVLTTQTYVYYGRFQSSDTLNLKAMIAFIWTCELAQALCIGHALYKWTISSFGVPLPVPPKSFDASIFFSGIIAACVQGFFSFRIWTLSRKPYIPGIAYTLSFLRLVIGAAVFITALRMTSLQIFEARFGWLITTAASIGAANDLLITTTLVFVLRGQRTEIQPRSLPLVDKLIVWTMETGLMTSVASIATLICFLTMKSNLIWAAVFVVVSRRRRFLVQLRKTQAHVLHIQFEFKGDAPCHE